MENKYLIGIDLDNTIWDLLTPWVEAINKHYKTNIKTKECCSYNMRVNVLRNRTIKDLSYIYDILEDEHFWDNVIPIKDAIKYITSLYEYGHKIYFVTHSTYTNIIFKINKLKKLFYFFNENMLINCSDKTLLDLDILIDDCPHYICDKYKIFTLRFPYTNEFIEDSKKKGCFNNIKVCDSWEQIYRNISTQLIADYFVNLEPIKFDKPFIIDFIHYKKEKEK